jgi:glycosyltransferase involved in cell wall biosynthesis
MSPPVMTQLPTSSGDRPRLMIFDLAVSGHHVSYLRYLVEFWLRCQDPCEVYLVVSHQLVEQHPDLVQLAQQSCTAQICFQSIPADQLAQIRQPKSAIARMFQEWRCFCQQARLIQPHQALLMYLDSLQIPLAFGAAAPCPVSGIYFRPTFHYSDFQAPPVSPGWKDRWRQWRQRVLLRLVMRRSHWNTVFCLDPFAIPKIQALQPHKPARHLADPIEPQDVSAAAIEQLRQQLGIAPARKVLLLFGSLSARKGILQVLQALQALPKQQAQQFCLVLAGKIAPAERPQIFAHLEQAQQQLAVQICLNETFIPEAQVRVYFCLADIVLAPYQRHVGMSGILLHTAAAQRPVLASNYGLMGELVRRYRLGLAVNSEDSGAIATALADYLQNPEALAYDPDQLLQLVQINHVEKFGQTLHRQLVKGAIAPATLSRLASTVDSPENAPNWLNAADLDNLELSLRATPKSDPIPAASTPGNR